MHSSTAQPETRLALIVATQRSGTTAIGRFLGSHPGIAYVGEIFHHVRGPHDDPNFERYLTVPEANFFTFKERWLTRFPALAYPSRGNQSALWRAYRRHLFALGPQTTWVIDVKYNSLHHLNAVWQDIFNPPLLVDLLREQKAPVLHLVRDDLFAQAISTMRAGALRKWHDVSSAPPAAPGEGALTFEPLQLDRLMTRSMHLRQHHGNMLSNYPDIRTLSYEDAFEDGRISNTARTLLADLFNHGVALTGETDLRKRESGSPGDRIANRDAVLEHFRDSPHENLVLRHLRPLEDPQDRSGPATPAGGAAEA